MRQCPRAKRIVFANGSAVGVALQPRTLEIFFFSICAFVRQIQIHHFQTELTKSLTSGHCRVIVYAVSPRCGRLNSGFLIHEVPMSGKGKDTKATRPRKSGVARNRRELEHRNRLAALGIPTSQIDKMDAKAVRAKLHTLSSREQPRH